MPRCKNCNDKFKSKYFLQKHCMEKEKCIAAEIQMKKDTIWKDKRAVMKIDTHSKEHKADLQREINKLARMIDAKFNFKCIDCEKEYGKQIDGAHFHPRGSNCSLRYNLHNIHSAKSDCNQYSDKHKEGYRKGLAHRYGFDYLVIIDELPLMYPELRLSNLEISEKLKLVRSLVRNFNTYQFIDAWGARNLFNTLIGIYK